MSREEKMSKAELYFFNALDKYRDEIHHDYNYAQSIATAAMFILTTMERYEGPRYDLRRTYETVLGEHPDWD